MQNAALGILVFNDVFYQNKSEFLELEEKGYLTKRCLLGKKRAPQNVFFQGKRGGLMGFLLLFVYKQDSSNTTISNWLITRHLPFIDGFLWPHHTKDGLLGTYGVQPCNDGLLEPLVFTSKTGPQPR